MMLDEMDPHENDLKPSKLKRDQFLVTYNRQQNWSLPDSIIYYITKNPSTSKVYQKIIQSCKYFFIKNPILIFNCLHIIYDEWKVCPFEEKCIEKFFNGNDSKNLIHLDRIGSKIWITDTFEDHLCNTKNLISSIIPKMCTYTKIREMKLSIQHLTFKEFIFLVSNVKEELRLFEIIVSYSNQEEKIVEFEKLMENCLHLKSFFYRFENDDSISSKTAKELSKLLPTSNIQYLTLYELTEAFDIKTFYIEFCKKNKKIFTDIVFCEDDLPDEFLEDLEFVLCEIEETEIFEYSPPSITVPGLDDYVQDYLLEVAKANYFGDK